MSNMYMEDYFFCYRSETVSVAEEFYNYLKNRNKYSSLNVWFSKERPTGNYKRDIRPAVKHAKGAVLFISEGFTRNFLNNESKGFECITALEMIEIAKRIQTDDQFLIIAVNVDGYTFTENDRQIIEQLLKKANITHISSVLDCITQIQKNPYFSDMHLSEKSSFWNRLASAMLHYHPTRSQHHLPYHQRKWLLKGTAVAITGLLILSVFMVSRIKNPVSTDIPAQIHHAQVNRDIVMPEVEKQYLEELLLQAKNDHLSKLLKDDPQAGIAKIQEDAKNGDRDAMYLLGTAYFWGEVVVCDDHEAFKWFMSAASLQHKESYFAIGLMYATGRGVEEDHEKAMEFFRIAVEKGYQEAEIFLNTLRLNFPTTQQEALQWMQMAADNGDTDAMCIYASLLLNGKFGLERNVEMGISYYTKAAEAGNTFAMFTLGNLYLNGDVVDVDYSKAVAWYTSAAQSNSDDPEIIGNSLVQLGCLYSHGWGVEKNDAEAFRLYQRAAELQHPHGIYNLGVCYFNGESVPQDYAKAAELYRSAAAKGHVHSMLMLGDMYFEGIGTSPNYNLAFEQYLQAAEAGSSYGMMKVGWFYQMGRCVSQSNEDAALWYQKASESADIDTYYPLSSIYLFGIEGIVEPDGQKGVEFLFSAAMSGHSEAIKTINKLLQIGALSIPTETGESVTHVEYHDDALWMN